MQEGLRTISLCCRPGCVSDTQSHSVVGLAVVSKVGGVAAVFLRTVRLYRRQIGRVERILHQQHVRCHGDAKRLAAAVIVPEVYPVESSTAR